MIMKMLTHLHVMVKHLWCVHICKGGERGEEKEVKLGLECYLRGTATPYPVHHQPYGGDRQWWPRGRCSVGGTTTPRAVPT